MPDTRIGHTLGHEIVGVVEELGRDATGLSVGVRVMLPFPILCGSCFYCQRGLTSSCESTNPATDAACGVYGYSHLTALGLVARALASERGRSGRLRALRFG